ncbi:MAG: sulfotransferase [Paracoccus denitrificans]|uniref:Sulfotransferase n=1 Tax=Paracoccus denitrificans TaxID=266 RepID=A0A533IAH4_PARDE|nr:MAG: sulfotransferase [Paracoccus denitrificans]
MLLHIGYHKAASTVLQDQIFFSADGCFIAPSTEPRHKLIERFVLPQPMSFDPETARAHYLDLIDQARATGRTFVLSHERFSGYPPAGGFDSSIIASRLNRSFPEARILIVVREQLASIYSMYMQYVTDGGGMSLQEYLQPPKRYFKRLPSFTAEFYRYHRLVERYRDLFGAERVLCLPFELLITDPAEFQSRIYAFAGQPFRNTALHSENRGRSPSFQFAQRLVNRHFGYSELNRVKHYTPEQLPRWFGSVSRVWTKGLFGRLDKSLEHRMKSRLQREFGDAFAESNAKLSQMMDYDIAGLGYQYPQGQALVA